MSTGRKRMRFRSTRMDSKTIRIADNLDAGAVIDAILAEAPADIVRVTSETEGPTNAEGGPSGLDFDQEELADPPPAVDEVAADVLVARMLAARPDTIDLVRHSAAIVIVEVPHNDWIIPVTSAWKSQVRGALAASDQDLPIPDEWLQSHAAIYEIHCTSDRKPNRDRDALEAVRDVVSKGRLILACGPSPQRCLPAEVVRAADLRLLLPRIVADDLVEIARRLTGLTPTTEIPPDVPPAVALDDLYLARRPDQTADQYLSKLITLVGRRMTSRAVTLESLHGMDEAVQWGRDLVADLQEYRQGLLPWSAIDRGALIYGPPGTGKTTFARALAATAGLPLVASSLSQWQATGHLGDLLNAMRATFNQARATAPCILFVDEIDSFGDRQEFTGHNRDYSTQVVNGFLEEMDGVSDREGVVVLGACNHHDRLDPAIVRSGRLDRLIHIPLPDANALREIFRYHLGADLPDADLSEICLMGLGSTGADCERWVRGARRRARRDNRGMVFDDLLAEVRGNRPVLPPEVRRRSAIHEAGHALVAALEFPPGSLIWVSILPTGDKGGMTTLALPPAFGMTRAECNACLRQLLAGRAAEEVVLGDASSGAGGDEVSDLARATTLAARMICGLGLAGGPLTWSCLPMPGEVKYLFAQRPDVASRVSSLLRASYRQSLALIRAHRGALDRLVERLLERSVIDGSEIDELVAEHRQPAQSGEA